MKTSVTHLSVEFIVTEVEGCVDGTEWLKINVHFLLLAIVSHNRAAVDNQSITRNYDKYQYHDMYKQHTTIQHTVFILRQQLQLEPSYTVVRSELSLCINTQENQWKPFSKQSGRHDPDWLSLINELMKLSKEQITLR